MKGLILGISIALMLIGCTNRQVYNAMQGARESQCRKIADGQKRDVCFESAREPYDNYERQRRERPGG